MRRAACRGPRGAAARADRRRRRRCRLLRSRGPGAANRSQGADLRRQRHRRLRRSWSRCIASFTRASRRLERCGRVIVLGNAARGLRLARAATPPSGRSRASRARSARRSGARLHGPARLRRAGRRGCDRLDPALPALPALGLRIGPGGPDRLRRHARAADRLGAAARGQGRARHGRLARHRRGDRDGFSPATVPSVVGSTCRGAADELRDVDGRLGGGDASRSTSPTPTRPQVIAEQLCRGGRRGRPQRRRHARPHAREDARGALERADGDQPLEPGAHQRRAPCGRCRCARTGASSASPR